MVEAFFIALLDHIAETFRGDEGGDGTLPLNQGIGGQCRAVDEHAHVLRTDARFCDELCRTFQHGQFRRMGGGQQFAAPAFGAVFQNDVGKSAANIGSEFICGCHLLHMPCSMGV